MNCGDKLVLSEVEGGGEVVAKGTPKQGEKGGR
jgi:hypothetical protein